MKRFIGGQRRVVELASTTLTLPSGAVATRMEKLQHGNRIVTLDSLRAVVALVVVIHHFWTIFYSEIHAQFGDMALTTLDMVQAQNHRAVMAFFVLSGFTIALTTQGRSPVRWKTAHDYLHRRIRRIVPLFYFSLAWTAALGAIFGTSGEERDFAWRTLAGNLLFLQTSSSAHGNWFVPYGGNGPYWSLSYEMAYYLVLPLVLVAVGAVATEAGPVPNRIRLRLIALGLSAMVAGLAMMSYAPSPFALFATVWIVWIAGFCAQGFEPKPLSLLIMGLPTLGSWALAGILALAGRRSDTLTGATEGTLLAFAFGVLVTWRGWTSLRLVRLFDKKFNAVFARIGRGSYATYLLHYPLLFAMHRVLNDGHYGIVGWTVAAMFFIIFVAGFCPLIEQVELTLFRSQVAMKMTYERSS